MGTPPDRSTTAMIADYMEAGFLDNIVEMLRQDRDLFPVIATLICDERSRVRLGAVALTETLQRDFGPELAGLIPHIAAGLSHTHPNVRADAAYLLGIIGNKEALPFLDEARGEEMGPVREIIRETIRELSET